MFKDRVFSSKAMLMPEGSRVKLCGWIHSIRDLGGKIFLLLRDKDGVIQIVASASDVSANLYRKVKELRKEYVVEIEGFLKATEKAPGGMEVHLEKLEVLNEASIPPHLEPDRYVKLDLEDRLENRVLDLKRLENRAIFKIGHVVLESIRSFLEDEGFIEVHTPRLIATATEGGAALFPIAYFECEAFLAQSPQLYKELLSSIFERVYEIGPFFRAEESSTNRHLSEYVGVDVEVAFGDEEDVMKFLENMITFVLNRVDKECTHELKLLEKRLELPSTPFKRLTYLEVIELLREHRVSIDWGHDLSSEAERTLGEIFKGPFFITDWPLTLKPFYIMPKEDGKTSYSFDLMYGRLEIASGGRRIHKKDMLIKRLEEQGLNPEDFKHHLKSFDHGMPPHAGWGLGLARLMMIITGKENIREVVLFPRDRWRLTP